MELSDGRDLFRGLACDGKDVDRFNPSAVAALGLLDLVMRDERAGVAWNDMFQDLSLSFFQQYWHELD